jgi:sphinganine-1-phosphate aldolase
MELPEHPVPADDILATLEAYRAEDARWREGRTFGLVFDGGAELHALVERVAAMFLHENALNPRAFPSLARLQAEVVAITADLLHAPEGAAGFMTSGGTESILMAVKAARERARVERGITEPEIVLPTSAHAAFHKGASYFGLTVRPVPVGPDFRADVEAMAAAVSDRTALVVGSAPQYPQGVVDPIPELASIATEVGANFHVDACMGGFVLPFMEQLGHPVPPWDFRVEGVTSISADLHKLGYAPKGASVILHRTRELRRYQTFVFDGWLGGAYASPGMQGTRSAVPIACAWATLHHLGLDGYLERTRITLDTAARIRAGLAEIDGIAVLGEPEAHLHAIAAEPGWEDRVDVFAVGDGLAARGWLHDRQTPPDSLHATVSPGNAPVVDEYLEDLGAVVEAVRGTRVGDRATDYAPLDER